MRWFDILMIVIAFFLLWRGRDEDPPDKPDTWVDVLVKALLIMVAYLIISGIRGFFVS